MFDVDEAAALEAANAVLDSFPDRYHRHLREGMRAKLGLTGSQAEDAELIEGLLSLQRAQAVDFTSCFRALSSSVLGDGEPARSLFGEPAPFDAWFERWRVRLTAEGADLHEVAEAMDRVNPVYIPRNHLVEEALEAATAGDLVPFERLVDVLSHPFEERPGLGRYAGPAPADFGDDYRTFCGT